MAGRIEFSRPARTNRYPYRSTGDIDKLNSETNDEWNSQRTMYPCIKNRLFWPRVPSVNKLKLWSSTLGAIASMVVMGIAYRNNGGFVDVVVVGGLVGDLVG